MPESAAPALPAVLRRRLSAHEQNVLLFAQRGGARLVAMELGGTAAEAETKIAATREKAARLIAAEQANGNGKPRRVAGEASCSRHGEYVDRGRGCPVCNVSQGGGSRPKPGGGERKADGPPTPAASPKRKRERVKGEPPKRRPRDDVRPMRDAMLDVAGVDDDDPLRAARVPSEQDGTLQGGASAEREAAGAAPPPAPPAASLPAPDDSPAPGEDPAPATDGPQLERREPSPEERAERERQVEEIREAAARQRAADEEGPWPVRDQNTVAGRSVAEQLSGDGASARQQRSREQIEADRSRIVVELKDGPLSQRALAVRLGLTPDQAKSDLRRLKAEGDVEPTGCNVFDWPESGRAGRPSPQWRITAEAHVAFEESLKAGDEEVTDERHGHNVRWTMERMLEAGRAAMLALGRELRWSDVQGKDRQRELPSGEPVRRAFGGIPAFVEACFADWPEGASIPRPSRDAPYGRASCRHCGEEFVRPAPNAVICSKDECQRTKRKAKMARRREKERRALRELAEREAAATRDDPSSGAASLDRGAVAPSELGSAQDVAHAEPAERPPPALVEDAERALIEAERWAQLADGALPETLLKGRYLAALLKRIEAGDTSAELLDRFERLAGL